MRKRTRALASRLLLLVLPWSALAIAQDEDAALMKACPGLATWAGARHHYDHPPAAAAAAVSDPALRTELATRVAGDQKVRRALTAAGIHDEATFKAIQEVDAGNLPWLKALVARQGFPTVVQVGKAGVDNAFLLVQHADGDPAFQAKVLAQIKPRLQHGDISRSDVALLTDRVLRSQGKPQRYGTQFKSGQDGNMMLQTTEDMAHLDFRRSRMDLMPMDDYRCMIRFNYPPASKDRP